MQKSRGHQGELWGLLNLLDLGGERPKMQDIVHRRPLGHRIQGFQPPDEAPAAATTVCFSLLLSIETDPGSLGFVSQLFQWFGPLLKASRFHTHMAIKAF